MATSNPTKRMPPIAYRIEPSAKASTIGSARFASGKSGTQHRIETRTQPRPRASCGEGVISIADHCRSAPPLVGGKLRQHEGRDVGAADLRHSLHREALADAIGSRPR